MGPIATLAPTLPTWVHHTSAHTKQDTEEVLYDSKPDELTEPPKQLGLWKEGEISRPLGRATLPFYQGAHERSGLWGITGL